MHMKRHVNAWCFPILLCVALIGLSTTPLWALTAGETYTITVYKVNSNGTTTSVSSTTVTADSNGKISFTLSNVPTSPTTNFIVLQCQDSSGTVVRKGFAPAPPAGSQNQLGINSLATSLTDAILKCGETAGTDDPILVAFGLVLTRSPGISDDDLQRIATLGNGAIRGTGGFEDFLTDNGVSTAQLETFRQKLVYNSASGSKDLSDFTAMFKNAVDNGDDDEMAKAGGFMAEIFVDAGNAAGIDPTLILAAQDAAGEVTCQAEYTAIMAAISSSVQNGMNQSMSSFFTRLAAIKLKTEYTDALTTLGASGTQVDTFNSAVQAMVTAFENIDTTYGDYFMDPDGYVDSHGTTHAAVQNAIDTAFDTAFSTFQSAIQSSNADITAMKQAVASAFGIDVGDLPSDFGTTQDFSGNSVNWPIPQTVMVNWVASIVDAGGGLTYTRDTLALPNGVQSWIGTCSDNQYFDQNSCEGNGGTWTAGRSDYSSEPDSFAALMGLEEDIRIIEFTRFAVYDNLDPNSQTQEQMKAAEKAGRLAFQQHLEAARDRIDGTVDGVTDITTSQKEAIIKVMQQPSLH
ncbi:MAG: hypothetical protein JRI36_10255 [Deltaproteobacteria bacterium]|nr:hypothetical protein [Deltaproteobacteria bacterium]